MSQPAIPARKGNSATAELPPVVGTPKYAVRNISDKPIQELYGVNYFEKGAREIFESPIDHTYSFKTYVGQHTVTIPPGGSATYLERTNGPPAEGLDFGVRAVSKRGGREGDVIESEFCCTVLPGWQPADATKDLAGLTLLPYVNGCSTKQIFPPDRPGDPTLQYLRIPAYSAEQAHHIHSTVRVVWVLSGHGTSVVGMDENIVTEELTPGKVCILEPMCPHHFETPFGKNLIVVPFHVFSTVPGIEANHPMFNGTFLMSQS